MDEAQQADGIGGTGGIDGAGGLGGGAGVTTGEVAVVDLVERGGSGEHKAEVRRRLLEAATEVYLDRGPAVATLADVAERAGTTVGTVELYFPSRHDLMSDLAGHIYVHSFRRYPPRHGGGGLGAFLTAFLRDQARPETRLIWRLGDALADDSPEGPDTAYWHIIAEIEKRLVDEGASLDAAHSRALVLAPALLLVARRAAFDLATEVEMANFVVAACRCANTAA